MTTTNFTTTVTIDQTAEEVYNAINNVKGWWHGTIEGSAQKVNDEFSYWFKEFHFSKQRVVELVPNQKIVWLVTDSDLKFQKNNEWTGTKLIFEINEVNDKTEVRFTHEGVVPTFECYGDCSWGWTQLIQESLPSWIMTGKGLPVFG